jgi:hypothetical protein
VSTTATRKDAPGTSAPPPPSPVAPPRTLSARRRRPALIGLSLALIAVGGLTGAVTMVGTGHRTPVLAIAQDIPVGSAITAQDLVTASISLDPALQTVPASDEQRIIGSYATVELKPGSLLTRSDVTNQQLVGPYNQVVGVLLKPGQLPSAPLTPGLQVLVVGTPAQDSDLPTSPPLTLPGEVVEVGTPDSEGNVTVDLSVASTDGPALAAWAATGRIAIIIQARSIG